MYWKKLPLGIAKDDKDMRIAVVELYLRHLFSDMATEGYEAFIDELYVSRYRPLYRASYFKDKGQKIFENFNCPITISDIKLTLSAQSAVIALKFENLTTHVETFKAIALDAKALIASIANAPEAVVKGFFYDYAEELIRWAIGPEKVVIYLYKCSGNMRT